MKTRVMFSGIVLSDIWQSGKSEETNGLSCVFMQDGIYWTHSKGSRQSACSSKGPCDLCLLNLNINKAKHRAAAVKQDSLALAQCSVIWVTCCGCTSEIVTHMVYSWDCYLYGLQRDCYLYGLQLRLLLVWLTARLLLWFTAEIVTGMAYSWVCSKGWVETGLDAITEAAEGSGEKPNEQESCNTYTHTQGCFFPRGVLVEKSRRLVIHPPWNFAWAPCARKRDTEALCWEVGGEMEQKKW